MARRLPLAERLRLASALIDQVVAELRAETAPRKMTPDEAYAALDSVRAHFAAQGPVSPTIADDMRASRR